MNPCEGSYRHDRRTGISDADGRSIYECVPLRQSFYRAQTIDCFVVSSTSHCKFAILTLYVVMMLTILGRQHPIMEKDADISPAADRVVSYDVGDVALEKQAQDARATEHNLTLKEAFILYRAAIGWSLVFSLGVIMAGFDPQLVGTLIAIPKFQHDFGVRLADGSYAVQAQWQSAFNLGVPVGQVVGAFGVGWPLEKIGRRWTLACCCTVTLITVALQTSANSRAQILVAELINGIVLGAYPVIAPTYMSEVCPVVRAQDSRGIRDLR